MILFVLNASAPPQTRSTGSERNFFQQNILKRSAIHRNYFITRDHNVLVVSERVERHKVQVEIDPTKLVQHQVPSQARLLHCQITTTSCLNFKPLDSMVILDKGSIKKLRLGKSLDESI